MTSAVDSLIASAEVADTPDGRRYRLRGIDWPTYRAISEAFNGRHLRFTYDRGDLEFMSKSSLHCTLSRLLGRLIVVLSEEMGLPIRCTGDFTLEREDLERGLEPDECY